MSEKQVTRFIAIHQFKAEEDQDLALEKGQLVLGNFLEDDWWVGEDPANGNAGVFPNNFVAIEGSEAADECLRKLASSSSSPPPTEEAATESKTRFIAIHQFKSENETDLPLEIGQLVLGNFVEGDWWVGEDPATGRAGVFPATFVAIEGCEAADECLRKLSKENKEPDANIIISTDPTTGIKYSYNKQTMETKWLTSDEKNDSPIHQIHLEIGDNDDDDDSNLINNNPPKHTRLKKAIKYLIFICLNISFIYSFGTFKNVTSLSDVRDTLHCNLSV